MDQASFNSAVALLRSYNGHTPNAFRWANPPNWATLDLDNNASSTDNSPDGLSLVQHLQQAQAINVEPFLARPFPRRLSLSIPLAPRRCSRAPARRGRPCSA